MKTLRIGLSTVEMRIIQQSFCQQLMEFNVPLCVVSNLPLLKSISLKLQLFYASILTGTLLDTICFNNFDLEFKFTSRKLPLFSSCRLAVQHSQTYSRRCFCLQLAFSVTLAVLHVRRLRKIFTQFSFITRNYCVIIHMCYSYFKVYFFTMAQRYIKKFLYAFLMKRYRFPPVSMSVLQVNTDSYAFYFGFIS